MQSSFLTVVCRSFTGDALQQATGTAVLFGRLRFQESVSGTIRGIQDRFLSSVCLLYAAAAYVQSAAFSF